MQQDLAVELCQKEIQKQEVSLAQKLVKLEQATEIAT